MTAKIVGRIHVLTDFHFQQHFSHARLAELALEGGADVIQFRDKGREIRHVLKQAQETAEVCRAHGRTIIVNDRIDVVQAVGADGVHLGQGDFPVETARAVLGHVQIIGATATTTGQAVDAEAAGADYIGFGPVYPTHSKANPASTKGLDGLKDVCAAVSIPVIAIAGITEQRIASVLECGAHGVAVMSAVSRAPDPAAATRRLRERIDDYLGL